MQRQASMTLPEMLNDLPNCCKVGTKRNAKGHKESWIGYKLHLDVADGDIPISCVMTSASLHDSEAAIPLAKMTAQRVTNIYDLMDSAYDVREIWETSRELGHVTIIDKNPRSMTGVKIVIAKATRREGTQITGLPRTCAITSAAGRSVLTAP